MQKTIHLSLENDHDDDNDAHDVMLVVIFRVGPDSLSLLSRSTNLVR